jgi:quercetin dioxygenase-like cupin family protein
MLDNGAFIDIGDHTVEILDTPHDTGDRYRLRVIAEPGAPGIKGDFPHLHPVLIETFTCVSGEMTVRVGKVVSVLPPGESAEVAPGQVHGFVNGGTDPLVVESEVIFPGGYKPRDDLLRFAAIYDRLRKDRPVKTSTEPPMLQMAVLTHAYRDVIRAPGIAGVLMPTLAALGVSAATGQRSPSTGSEPS